jgi:hypothetical protein
MSGFVGGGPVSSKVSGSAFFGLLPKWLEYRFACCGGWSADGGGDPIVAAAPAG